MRFLVAAIATAFFCLTSARGAVFEVTSAADSGSGTLRDAVASADALAGADLILFSDGLGEIILTSGQIDVVGSVAIRGPEDGQRISGGFNSRIFALRSDTATLTLENLVLFDGQPFDPYPSRNDVTDCGSLSGQGGAVCAEGNVVIKSSSLFGNIAFERPGGGAVYARGTAVIQDSLIESNTTVGFNGSQGGGVTAYGAIVLENSVVSGNQAQGEGGGLMGFGGVEIRGSEIGNNLATSGAGGVSARDEALIVSSTISGNEGGGVNLLSGSLTVRHSTIVRNNGFLAGGITVRTTLTDPSFLRAFIFDTILAENTGNHGNLRSNLIQEPYASGSLFGDSASEIENGGGNLFLDTAELHGLADNGCGKLSGAGATARCAATHAMPFSSPVRDGGGSSSGTSSANDQRGAGFPRYVGPRIDIGALESAEVELLFGNGFE